MARRPSKKGGPGSSTAALGSGSYGQRRTNGTAKGTASPYVFKTRKRVRPKKKTGVKDIAQRRKKT